MFGMEQDDAQSQWCHHLHLLCVAIISQSWRSVLFVVGWFVCHLDVYCSLFTLTCSILNVNLVVVCTLQVPSRYLFVLCDRTSSVDDDLLLNIIHTCTYVRLLRRKKASNAWIPSLRWFGWFGLYLTCLCLDQNDKQKWDDWTDDTELSLPMKWNESKLNW